MQQTKLSEESLLENRIFKDGLESFFDFCRDVVAGRGRRLRLDGLQVGVHRKSDEFRRRKRFETRFGNVDAAVGFLQVNTKMVTRQLLLLSSAKLQCSVLTQNTMPDPDICFN